jgi:alpha-tubulin suppressor-like RCC1 family protein
MGGLANLVSVKVVGQGLGRRRLSVGGVAGKVVVASALVGALLAGSVVGASAASAAPPTPDSGPAAGGTTVTVEAPVAKFTQVSAGAMHAMALVEDGNAYGWGENTYGAIGDRSTTSKSFPKSVVQNLNMPRFKFTQVYATGGFTVALDSAGKVWTWGKGVYGVLGTGPVPEPGWQLPTQVITPVGVTFTKIAAGGGHTLALGSDGNVYAWGNDGGGQLGRGTVNGFLDVPTPVKTPEGVTFTDIWAGGGRSMALGSDGKFYAWGADGISAANGTPTAISMPEGVPADFTFTQISPGGHTVALGNDGKAYAWGDNGDGQLGIGSVQKQYVPTPVSNPADVPAAFKFTQIVVGSKFTLALGNDGKTYAWGDNFNGQLGDGTSQNKNVPTLVKTPAGVTFTQISAGGAWEKAFAVALGDDGNAYAWGANTEGQLGIGAAGYPGKNTPTLVVPLAVAVTGVLFDGKPGTGLAANPDGTYQVKTPANTKCEVDVTVQWTRGGEPQPDIVHPSGFTYLQAPTITDPVGATAPVNGSASFTATPSGCTAPVSAAWEYSSDNGANWSSALALPSATVDAAGTTLTVASIQAAYHGYQFRAVATNAGGTVTSAAATLSVQASVQAKVTYDPNGGTGTMADTTGVAGEQVTLAANKFTRAGHTFGGWNTKADGSGARYAARANYPSLPAGGVTLYAQWTVVKKDDVCSTPRPVAVFEDTPVGHKFYKEIDWMHCMKYSTGWRQPPRKPVYKPADNISREAMAAFIYRMDAPKNYVAPQVSPFADMKPGDVFYKEISWMYEAKLSTGWAEPSGKPTFRPKEKLSREAMAAFIYRMEAPKGYKAPAKSPMADMKPGMKFYKEISWMYDEDLSTGNKVGNTKEYWPKDKLSRQAMAAFIYRLVTDYRVNS